ncbi:baseplate J/gp47 family protein [Chengkuizengella sp. SCS-71B]|uniref:baseplate J/gp47 family protein n=1 Tax=Chengkuizengella sp. SCS-71B TaxID=3115290 RepID=UPI0032C23C1A
MYEDQTYDYILKRMLESVPDNVDKREGSIIYDALAPSAIELAQMYEELDSVLKLGFAGTSTGEFLALRAKEMGVIRREPTKAKRKGLFYGENDQPIDVVMGSRFSISNVHYVVIEKQEVGEFILECEISGEIGNQSFGTLLPMDYIEGLVRAELSDVLVPGTDEEDDESLTKRYQDKVSKPRTSGNVNDYYEWATSVKGVGDARIISLWNGRGTVKIIIVDSTYSPASDELVSNVQEYLESIIPIGHTITVESAETVPINVSATLTLQDGSDVGSVKSITEESISTYLRSISFRENLVRISKVGAILLTTEYVVDHENLTINSSTQNIQLSDTQIPVLGTVTINEI